MGKRRRDKGQEKAIARTRIKILLQRAHKEAQGPDHDLSHRYAALAQRLGARYKVSFHPDQKMQVCRSCGAYRGHTRTGRVRIRAGRLTWTCLQCGRTDRQPLTPRQPPTNPRRTPRKNP